MRRVPLYKQKRDPNGKKLCLVCNGPLPKHRSSYCSDECWTRNTPAMMRAEVWRRDKGVCAICGKHTTPKKESIEELHTILRGECFRNDANMGVYLMARDAQRNLRELWPYESNHTWEMDHITPVVEGGGLCGLDGYRTLCLDCHHAVSADLARRRALKTRISREALPLLECSQ